MSGPGFSFTFFCATKSEKQKSTNLQQQQKIYHSQQILLQSCACTLQYLTMKNCAVAARHARDITKLWWSTVIRFKVYPLYHLTKSFILSLTKKLQLIVASPHVDLKVDA